LKDGALPSPLDRYPEAALTDSAADATRRELRAAYHARSTRWAPTRSAS
jgi:hypothetical protein